MPNLDPEMNTVVIGAGQAGLAVSRCLGREGVPHVVLERDAVGASWRQRWDSFFVNTPNVINQLPDVDATAPPEGFLSRDAWVSEMEAYQRRFELPVQLGVEVLSVVAKGEGYEVNTSAGTTVARNVIVCSGDQNVPSVPAIASALPEDITQLHSLEYRNPRALPPGGVLVVGSGQTGAQIAEDLLGAGRSVWLSTSKVGRVPRRYRGKDITIWMGQLGMAYHKTDDVPREERESRQPLATGVGGGRSISLHSLARAGAHLLGRLEAIDGRRVKCAGDLLGNVEAGEAQNTKIRAGLDAFIEKSGADAPPPEPDPADEPFAGMATFAADRELDLEDAGIRSVIWATGYRGNFTYLPAQFLDEQGRVRHHDGVIAPGLYCAGFMWLRTRSSGLIRGVGDDAQAIVAHVGARAG